MVAGERLAAVVQTGLQAPGCKVFFRYILLNAGEPQPFRTASIREIDKLKLSGPSTITREFRSSAALKYDRAALYQTFSNAIAMPCPTPMHMVASA